MAVAVEGMSSVVLDEADRIVEVSSAAAPWFGHYVGKNAFECFPGSRALFRPHYERARRTGQTVEFAQFYGRHVMHLCATPCPAGLEVTWETLAILDTWTLAGLQASLDTALDRLDEMLLELERRRTKATLRIVGGS